MMNSPSPERARHVGGRTDAQIPRRFGALALRPVLALAILLAGALPVSAQVVRGRVVQADAEAPIGNVSVTIFGNNGLLRVAETDSLGHFEFDLPGAGRFTLFAAGEGFETIGPVPFTAPAGRVLNVVIRMAHDVVVLDPVLVNVRAMPRNSLDAARQRSTDNRQFGIGFHMGREEIDASKRSSTIELIESMTPTVRFVTRRPKMQESGRGYSPLPGELPEDFLAITRFGTLCPLALYVDGIHIDNATPEALPAPGNVDTVEIYPGPDQRGGYVDPNSCGLALIWTRANAGPSAYRRTLLGSLVMGGMAALAAVVLIN